MTNLRRSSQALLALVCAFLLLGGVSEPALSATQKRPQAYNADVHYDLTYILAVKAGFSKADAEKVAKCNEGVDDDQSTVATALGTGDSASSNFRFHFVKKETLSDLWHNKIKSGKNLCNLGVFLHAVQDNFSHRDHLKNGHHGLSYDPDYTHKDTAKARRMAYNTYRLLIFYRWYDSGKKVKLGGQVRKNVSAVEQYVSQEYPKIEQQLDLLRWLKVERTKRPWVLQLYGYIRYVNGAHETMGIKVPESKGVQSLKSEGAKLEIFQAAKEGSK